MNAILLGTLSHWKSTVNGFLTIILATIGPLLALPNIQTIVSAKTLLILGGVTVVGKAWVSLITQDADKVLATVPGSPEPKVVPGHLVPDMPGATAVVPQQDPIIGGAASKP